MYNLASYNFVGIKFTYILKSLCLLLLSLSTNITNWAGLYAYKAELLLNCYDMDG